MSTGSGKDRLAAAWADRYHRERHLGQAGALVVVENWFTELKAKVKR